SGWIEKIRDFVNCPPSGVMMTPGNHDVDRDAIVAEIEALHESIREASSLQERDSIIAAILRDAVQGPQLMASISAYNDLARAYDCQVSPEEPFWERDFPLGNRGILKIRGVTSTLISGPKDHSITHKVVYGGAQRTLMRSDNVF